MKTILSTGPQLIAVKTSKLPGVKKGTVQVQCVSYETYEMTDAEFDATTFKVHDANQEHAKTIAKAVAL